MSIEPIALKKKVVAGRARLGGIPVGVIAVETRVVELNLPADPANPDSEAKVDKKFCLFEMASLIWFLFLLGHLPSRSSLVPRFRVQDGPGHVRL